MPEPDAATAIDYDALTSLLMERDKLPTGLREAFYFIHEMATPEGMECLLAAAEEAAERTGSKLYTKASGIVTKTFHDDLGRQTHVAENWDNFTVSGGGGGSGTGPDDKDRVTACVYNGLGQITQQSALDANGDGNRSDDQNTLYLYEDPYNVSLVTNIIYPDSSNTDSSGSDQVKLAYNLDGSIASRTDQNGTVIAFTYTSRRQLEYQSVITVGSGVDDHVRSIGRSYDDLARVEKVTSYQNTSGGGDIRNEIAWQYNDLGQVTTTWQSHDGAAVTPGSGGGSESPKVQYAYDLSASSSVYNDGGRLDHVTYPSGRAIRYHYGAVVADKVHRVRYIRDSNNTDLVWYHYSGLDRLVSAHYRQTALKLRRMWGGNHGIYQGYDRFGRVRRQHWHGSDGGTPLPHADTFRYSYDYAGNRLNRDIETGIYPTNDKDQKYTYDGLHRLVTMDRGTLSGSSITSPNFEQDWSLDQLGNWDNFVEKTSGTTTLDQDRAHNLANEITNITTNTGSSWIIPAHDAAGNMTSAPSAKDPTKRHWYIYDAWNRLVAVWEDDGDSTKEITGGSPDDTLIARYEYDGQNRRVAKEIYSGGVLDHKLHNYYNENWQILEVRKETGGTESPNPLKQYVWHTYYIDAPAIRYYDPDTDGSNIETQYFTHDANFNVTALTDDTGAVIERYDYTPYSQVTILKPDFTNDADGVSDYEQDVLFAGYQYDAESGMYNVRFRNLHTILGRWVQSDPAGYIDGMSTYLYAKDNPIIFTDGMGLVVDARGYEPPTNRLDFEGKQCCLTIAPRWTLSYPSRWACASATYAQHSLGLTAAFIGLGSSGSALLVQWIWATPQGAALAQVLAAPAMAVSFYEGGAAFKSWQLCGVRVCTQKGRWRCMVKSAPTPIYLFGYWDCGLRFGKPRCVDWKCATRLEYYNTVNRTERLKKERTSPYVSTPRR